MRPAARGHGFDEDVTTRIWAVLKAFASFGFCKAHAAAFAVPTYQSAWLKAHHPAAFLAGVLTHDPGMYPKRLILDDARNLGITRARPRRQRLRRGLRVERSMAADRRPRRCRVAGRRGCGRILGDARRPEPASLGPGAAGRPALRHPALARRRQGDQRGRGGADRRGAAVPQLADFWHRAHVSRPVTERLVLAGAFDTLYGIDTIGAGVDPGHAHRPRHRGVRAAHAPEGGGRGARGYGSADWANGEAGDDGDYSGGRQRLQRHGGRRSVRRRARYAGRRARYAGPPRG